MKEDQNSSNNTNSLIQKFKKMVDKRLADLASSENPARVGDYKPSMRVFAYRVGSSHRIIYSIRYNDGVIELLRVCDHKSVYGKD